MRRALAPLAGDQQDPEDRQQEPLGGARVTPSEGHEGAVARSGAHDEDRDDRRSTVIDGDAISSQRPARVSAILRSSTGTSRENGTGAVPETSSVAAARRRRGWVRRGQGLGCSCGDSFALGVGGELEEQRLEAGALGRPQLEQDDAGLRRRPCPTCSRGRPRSPATVGGVSTLRSSPASVRARSSAASVERPGRSCRSACSSSALRPLGDDPALADQDHVVGDHLDLVQQVGGQQHRAAAGGVVAEQAAHPVDAGRVEAVGGLVEDQHGRGHRAARGRCRAAAASRGSSCCTRRSRLGRRRGSPARASRRPGPSGSSSTSGAEGQDLPAGAAGVLGGGVEQHPDVAPGVRDARR